jgi:predicted ester cyclase
VTTAELEALARRLSVDIFTGKPEIADEVFEPELARRVKELAAVMRAGFPDLAVEVVHLVAADDKVACRWSASGTHRGFFHGVPPTQARVSFTGTSIYIIDGNRVRETTANWDLFGLLAQLRAALQR